jgi:hypothetical protein
MASRGTVQEGSLVGLHLPAVGSIYGKHRASDTLSHQRGFNFGPSNLPRLGGLWLWQYNLP